MSGVAVLRVQTAVRGRLLTRRASAPEAPLLVGFHGYGETAERHLEALERIPGAEGWHLAAIQALHPFYRRDGEVVASWMTRLDRELAVEDNVAYVARAIAAARRELATHGRLALAGFSQGTAMAWRAAALAVDGCDGVIALAGDLPAELEEAAWRSRPRALLGRGTRDGWYDEEKERADLARLARLGMKAEACVFDGGHEWSEAFLERCGRFLAEEI